MGKDTLIITPPEGFVLEEPIVPPEGFVLESIPGHRDITQQTPTWNKPFDDLMTGVLEIQELPGWPLTGALDKDIAARAGSAMYYHYETGLPPEQTFDLVNEFNMLHFGQELPAETGWKRIKQRYANSKAEVQAMDLGYQVTLDLLENPDAFEERLALLTQIQGKIKEDYWLESRGLLERAFGGTAQVTPFSIEAVKAAPGPALTGGVFGGLFAIGAGSLSPLPEEVISVPKAVALGIKVGAAIGAADRVRQLEAGGQMLELMQMKDKYGNKIDPKIAVVASHLVGAINGAIEVSEWATLLSTFGVGTKVFESAAGKVTSKLMAEGTLKQIVAKYVLKYGATLSAEVLQELEQETTNIVATQFAAEINNQMKGTGFAKITPQDIKKRYEEIFTESMYSFGLLVAPGTMVSGAIEAIGQKGEAKPTAPTKPTPVVEKIAPKPPEALAEAAKEEEYQADINLLKQAATRIQEAPGVAQEARTAAEPTVTTPPGKPAEGTVGGEIIDKAIREDLIEKYVAAEDYQERVKSQLVQELADITGRNPDEITDVSPKAIGDLIDIESLPESQQETIRNLVTDYADATEKMRTLQTKRKRMDTPLREFEEQPAAPAEGAVEKPAEQGPIYDRDGVEISGLFGEKPVLNEDGTLTVYHATTQEAAEKIKTEGLKDVLKIENGEVYVSTKPKGGTGFGGEKNYVVELRIRPDKLSLDDAFRDGELHLHGNEKDLKGSKVVSVKPVKSVENLPPLVASTIVAKAKSAEGAVEKTVYRGDIEKGRPLEAKIPSPTDVRGIYFAESEDLAQTYADMGQEPGRRGVVQKYTVRLEHPASETIEQSLLEELDAPQEEDGGLYTYTLELADEVADILQERGYDGIIRDNGEVVVFDKNAVKPAAGAVEKAKAKPVEERAEKPAAKGEDEGIEEPAPIRPELVPIQEVPIENLTLSTDVPNFKARASKTTGVVEGEELQGKYKRLGTGAVVIWERSDGRLEVITGRHRLDLAKRTGEKTIPAQIVKESEGFTRQMAMTLDAEANIRDGQGSVKDYANYFRNTEISEDVATEEGLLSRVKSKVGWAIGKSAVDDVYVAFSNGKISEAKAAAIASGAPNNQRAQQLALMKESELSADELRDFARMVARMKPSDTIKPKQSNLFGFDESAIEEAEAIAKEVSKERTSIKDRILAVKGALKRPVQARKMGLEFSDEATIAAEVQRLENRLDDLTRVSTTPALYKEMRQRAGLGVAEAKPEIAVVAKEEEPVTDLSIYADAVPPTDVPTRVGLQNAVARALNEDAKKIVASKRKYKGLKNEQELYDKQFTDKPELFVNPENPIPEMRAAWTIATKGKGLFGGDTGKLPGGRQAGGTILFSPQEWAALIRTVNRHIASGLKTLEEVTAKLVADFGEWIRPYVQQAWDEIHGVTRAEKPPEKAKRKKSKLTRRIEKRLKEEFEDAPGYEGMNMAHQAEMVAKMHETDPERLERIGRGFEEPTGGMRVGSAYMGLKVIAIKEGNIDLLRDLAVVSVTKTASEFGQEIKAFDVPIENDPVRAMQEVAAVKEKAVSKKMRVKSTASLQTKMAKEMKATMRKQASMEKLRQFILDLEC